MAIATFFFVDNQDPTLPFEIVANAVRRLVLLVDRSRKVSCMRTHFAETFIDVNNFCRDATGKVAQQEHAGLANVIHVDVVTHW